MNKKHSLTRRLFNLILNKSSASNQVALARDLANQAESLRVAAEGADPAFAKVFWQMAGHLQRISAEVEVDVEDFRALRQFAGFHAVKIVEMAQKLAALQERNAMASEFTSTDVLAKFEGYCDLFRRAESACVSNDVARMKQEMAALDIQLSRLNL